jgi:hypothetical protein
MASEGHRPDRLTLWQRSNLRRMRKASRKREGEPLTSEDWEAYYRLMSGRSSRLCLGLLRSLPSSPRCGICGAPFAGLGSRLVKPLGYRPSRKNPTFCDTCIEASPPGGMTTEVGVLFADLRGFTRLSEQSDPEAVSALLRRFYACAERVLFPEAIIDKLIGDVVNVASRLQGEAKGGEIVASGRLVEQLQAPVGERVEVSLKGKAEPVIAYRVRAGTGAAATAGLG